MRASPAMRRGLIVSDGRRRLWAIRLAGANTIAVGFNRSRVLSALQVSVIDISEAYPWQWKHACLNRSSMLGTLSTGTQRQGPRPPPRCTIRGTRQVASPRSRLASSWKRLSPSEEPLALALALVASALAALAHSARTQRTCSLRNSPGCCAHGE